MKCFKCIVAFLKALRLKRCHSSCCDIEIESSVSPRQSKSDLAKV